jgi:hypothetical protein
VEVVKGGGVSFMHCDVLVMSWTDGKRSGDDGMAVVSGKSAQGEVEGRGPSSFSVTCGPGI